MSGTSSILHIKGQSQSTSTYGHLGIGSTTPTTSLNIVSGNNNYTLAKNYKYNILGEDVESDNMYGDQTMAISIATINLLGIAYYVELKKQGISFHGKIGDFLEYKLKSYMRDSKIEEVLEQNK